MKSHFILAASLLIALMSCQSKGAYSYNQYIVEKEKKIGAHTDDAVQRFNIYSRADRYDSLAIVSQQVEEVIENELHEIKEKEIPADAEGGAELKTAAIRYFSYMKSVFSSYRELGNQTNKEAREAARRKLREVLDRNAVETQALQEAQRKFGRANNLRMK